MAIANTIETVSALELLGKLITKLEGLFGETGVPTSGENSLVDKNIIQGSASTFSKKPKISPTLVGNEQRAVRSIGLELARAFYDFNLKKKEDEKPQTLIRSINKEKIQPTGKDAVADMVKKDSGSWWKWLALAGLIAAFAAIWEHLGPVGAFITKLLLKLPRLLSSLGKGMSILKDFIKAKWPSLAKAFEPITKLTKDLKAFFKLKWDKFKQSFKFLGDGLESIRNLFRFGKPVQELGEGAGKAAKSLKPTLSATQKTVGKSLLKRIKLIPFIGSLASFTFAYFRFKEGQWVRGTMELLSGILNLSGAFWPVSLMLDGMLIVYDLLEDKSETAAGATSLKTGKYLITPVLKSVAKKLGTKALTMLKFIPFIGSLANFAAAYLRFQDGQWIKGTFEIVAGILSLFGPTHALAMVIDGALILHDLMEVKGTDTGEGKVITTSYKVGSKAIIKTLTKLGVTLGARVLKVMKFIPVIGGLANIALGFYRIQQGEWVAGIFEFISGICDFFPGYGTAASLVIDGALIIYDLLKSPKDESEKPTSTEASKDASGKLKQAEKGWFSKFTDALWNLPGLSSLMYIGQGIGKLVSGNITDGLLDLARSVPGGSSGRGLVGVLESAAGFFTSGTTDKKVESTVKAKEFSITGFISDMLGDFGNYISSALTRYMDSAKKTVSSWKTKTLNFLGFGDDEEPTKQEQNKAKLRDRSIEGSVAIREARKQGLGMEKWDETNFNNFLNTLKIQGYNKQHDELLSLESKIRGIYNTGDPTKEIDQAQVREAQKNLISLYSNAQRLIKTGNESQQKNQENFTKMFNESTRSSEIPEAAVPSPIVEVTNQPINLDVQNNLINRQTNILSEMLAVTKQQLASMKAPVQPVVVQSGGNSASSVNMNNAFSTSKGDSRYSYNSSPYSLNAT